MNNDIRYLNNGKISQTYPIHSTKIKNSKIKVTNGKIFSEELTVAFKEDNYQKLNPNNKEETNFTTWVMNILNPLNHIPIVSTINKIANKKSKSLDIAQAAIGGAIYGGGPIGLVKGIGGWIVNKLIPQNKFASNSKVIEDKSTKSDTIEENKKTIENITDNQNSLKSSKLRPNQLKENINTSKILLLEQTEPTKNNLFNYLSKEEIPKKNLIDTNA